MPPARLTPTSTSTASPRRGAPAPGRRAPALLTPAMCAAVLGVVLVVALLAGGAVLPALTRAAEPLQARRPGEEVVIAGCLRLAVLGMTDRNGPLDPVDWVTLKVTNGCDEPVRHLQVDLLLQDLFGRVYGVRTWVLERGEVLPPGRSKTDRYAVPDASDHMPRRWAVRLRHVEKPSQRRRRAEATASAPRG